MSDSPINRTTNYDLAIVGGGAAGLMAAIFAGRAAQESGPKDHGWKIAVLDGARKLGAKILVAGGGRCNVTHDVVTAADFAGGKRTQIAKVLRTFAVPATTTFFAELGVPLKREDTGKLFPTTDRSQTVLDALLRAAGETGVALLTEHRVAGIRRQEDAFLIQTNHSILRARTVILATGGQSLPKTGSDGAGYALARSLGHTITPTFPALVPLVLEDRHYLTTLTGISVDAELTVHGATGQVLRRERGAMLFTHLGLSGPVVLDISRHWLAARTTAANVRLTANLLPDEDFASLETWLLDQTQQHPRATIAATLRKRRCLPERALSAILHHAGLNTESTLAHLNKADRRNLLRTLLELPLPVVRDRGYLFAEATAGGVPLDELDLATMASRCCPGLFLCGEILDVDGRVGGYNFQWAWCTGRLAGRSAVVHALRRTAP